MNRPGSDESGVPSVGGVTILAAPGLEVRVLLSAGTRQAGGPDGPWREGARIPREPWREAAEAERGALLSPSPGEAGRTLVLFKPPPRIVAQWRALARTPDSRFGQTAKHVMGSAEYGRAIEDSISYLRGLTRYGARPLNCFVAETHAGRASTCWDSKEFVGLHVDVRERTPLSECEFSPTRFCLNIGRYPRGFTFGDLTLLEMVRRLRRSGHEISGDASPQLIADRFLSAFEHHPMVRVVLRPGEAYLAPTDNFIHDGFTQEIPPHACDLVVMAIGYFDPGRALASTELRGDHEPIEASRATVRPFPITQGDEP